MSEIKVDALSTVSGSGSITVNNNLTASGNTTVSGNITTGNTSIVTGGRFISSQTSNDPWLKGVNSSNTETSYIKKDGQIYSAFGISLGGTGAANTLDDYEEGTFEVVITGTISGTATGNSGAGAGASYTKIGNTVFYRGYFANPTISGTMDGSLRLALPFTNADIGRFDNGSGGFIVGHREISSGTTSNEITLKTNRNENFARLRRKYTVNSRLEDVDLTQGNASINSSTLLWFQGIIKV